MESDKYPGLLNEQEEWSDWQSDALLKGYRRLTIREMSEEAGLCHAIVTQDLGMIRAVAKFDPQVLTAEQMENRLFADTALLIVRE